MYESRFCLLTIIITDDLTLEFSWPLHQEKGQSDPRFVPDLDSTVFQQTFCPLSLMSKRESQPDIRTDISSRRTDFSIYSSQKQLLLFSICVLCEERKVTVITDVSGHAELISKHTNALPLNCPTSFTICTSNLHFKPLFLFIAVSQYQDSPLNPNQESQKTAEKHIFKIKSYLSLTANY